MESKIIISQGKRFESVGVVFSFLTLIIFAVFSIFSFVFVILFVLMLMVVIFIFTHTTGVEIDLESNQIKVFSKSFFHYNQKAHDFDKYCSLSILTTKKSYNLYSYRFNSEVSSGVVSYKTSDVFFMDKNHRRRVYLNSFEDYLEAKEFAKILSLKTQKPLLKYAPKKIMRRKR